MGYDKRKIIWLNHLSPLTNTFTDETLETLDETFTLSENSVETSDPKIYLHVLWPR